MKDVKRGRAGVVLHPTWGGEIRGEHAEAIVEAKRLSERAYRTRKADHLDAAAKAWSRVARLARREGDPTSAWVAVNRARGLRDAARQYIRRRERAVSRRRQRDAVDLWNESPLTIEQLYDSGYIDAREVREWARRTAQTRGLIYEPTYRLSRGSERLRLRPVN